MTNDIIKDPVCRMTVQPSRELTGSYDGQTFSFCSEFCRDMFLEHPERYVTAFVTSSPKFLLGKCSSKLVRPCFCWRKLLRVFLFVPM
jgi:YHS domain-containing protein